MTGAGFCADSLLAHSTGSAERSTARESAGDHPLVFLSSWPGAADRRNEGILSVYGMPQGQGRYDEAVEKG